MGDAGGDCEGVGAGAGAPHATRREFLKLGGVAGAAAVVAGGGAAAAGAAIGHSAGVTAPASSACLDRIAASHPDTTEQHV